MPAMSLNHYTIQARDEAHIAALFADLQSVPGVLMVL